MHVCAATQVTCQEEALEALARQRAEERRAVTEALQLAEQRARRMAAETEELRRIDEERRAQVAALQAWVRAPALTVLPFG